MEWKLVDEGLTPKEARKAISLARAKQEIGMTYPPKRELCYELLTEEDRKPKWKSQSMATRGGGSISSKSSVEFSYFDTKSGQILQLKEDKFVDQASKLGSAVQSALAKIGKIGGFELSEFTVSVELGVSLIIKAGGSIQMKWTKPKP